MSDASLCLIERGRVRRKRLRFVDTHTIQKAWLGNRTRDSRAMNATETVTETARNTNPIDASRRMSDANVVSKGRARDGQEACSVNMPRTVAVASTTKTLCEASAERHV